MSSRRFSQCFLLVIGTSLLASCGGGGAEQQDAAQSANARYTAQAVAVAKPASAVWGASVTLPLVPVSGAVLSSGKMMLWAADAPNNSLASGGGHTYASLVDTQANTATLTNITATGQNAFCVGTSRLGDGRLLVNGGDNPGLTSLYDPATDTWSAAASLNTPRGYNANATLADGSVLTMGGSWSAAQVAKTAEIFTVAGGWRNLPGISTADATFLTADPRGYYRPTTTCG